MYNVYRIQKDGELYVNYLNEWLRRNRKHVNYAQFDSIMFELQERCYFYFTAVTVDVSIVCVLHYVGDTQNIYTKKYFSYIIYCNC